MTERSSLDRTSAQRKKSQNSRDQQMQTAAMDTPTTDRIAVVDILRAIALFGIVINHASLSFLAGMEPDPLFNIVGPLDRTTLDLAELLTFG